MIKDWVLISSAFSFSRNSWPLASAPTTLSAAAEAPKARSPHITNPALPGLSSRLRTFNTGTGASGDTRSTSPDTYRSRITSPATNNRNSRGSGSALSGSFVALIGRSPRAVSPLMTSPHYSTIRIKGLKPGRLTAIACSLGSSGALSNNAMKHFKRFTSASFPAELSCSTESSMTKLLAHF